jgi:DNA-directed RNA polymerase subunit K/omega
MSDNEYDSDNDSNNSSDSDSVPIKKTNLLKPKVGKNILEKVGSTIDDDSESDEEDVEDIDEDLNQVGGIGDDDQEDIMSTASSEDEPEEDDDEEEDEEEQNEDEENKSKKPVKNKSKKPAQIDLPSDDEDEEYDDSYLQKFDSEVTKNYVNEFHPECLIQNYDEISKLTNVVRDAHNIIIDPLHKTIPFLTKYEKARILGQRAKQIEVGAKPFISVPENVIDSYIIAELELQQKRIPFIIRRPIPGGGFEYWNIRDLEVIGF